ncbi:MULTISPECIES: hypothetical protein [unclassified Aeromicrobium]|uniref:hypothetical protein n=1 Tax=unclassified Aeromicrobium TaxID=2633570 RepID=UPI00396B3B14
MRTSWVVPFLLVAALLGGCGASSNDTGDGDGSSPSETAGQDAERVLRQYLMAADEGDCEAVKETVLVPEDLECGDVRDQEGQWTADGADLEDVPMSAEVVDDSATVTVQWPDGLEDNWDLQREGDTWYVLTADTADGV